MVVLKDLFYRFYVRLKLLMLEIIVWSPVKLSTFRKTDPFSLKMVLSETVVILNKIHS